VALSLNNKIIARRETLEEKSHASMLTVYIDEILKEADLSVNNLDAIAVGKGPGSYTGLRIGISAAKGLCFGSGVPLIAINTLQILYQQVMADLPFRTNADTLYCPMIDARRMEVFTCLYDQQGDVIDPTAARIIDNITFKQHLSERTILFFGSGMEKCREVVAHPNAIFIPGIYPHASALARLAEISYRQQNFENLAYFEPYYLKDFVATVSKKRLQV
jgi:tRNA threonylcarbamoyladenosine biosynthesis protein TsaB